MNDISTQISQLYEETFTLEKLREDLYLHLIANVNDFYSKTDFGYEFDIFIEDKEEWERVTISEDEEITIIDYQSHLERRWGFYFNITIGLGKYVEDKETGFFTIEKGLAKLRYRFDLVCYDIEFYTDSTIKEKGHKHRVKYHDNH